MPGFAYGAAMIAAFMFPSSKAGRLWLAAAVLATIIVAGVVVYLTLGQRPPDVSHPNVEFAAPRHHARPGPAALDWPIYGYNPARTRYLDVHVGPPFRRVWSWHGSSLLEFSPVLADGRLFLVDNSGLAEALSARTGRPLWKRSIGTLAASSMGWWHGRLFVVSLSGVRNKKLYANVHVMSLSARTGRVFWRKPLSSGAESGPMVVYGHLYFGTEDGTVYSLDPRTGRTIWTYRAAGPVKGALAYDRGRLFLGDYSGDVTALRARDGHRLWEASTAGLSFGRSGTFYSTPAVAFGRVYVGNTDGRVYSFAERTGQVAWSHTTGAYVYASPAVADLPGIGPTVYVGSYDGHFYAFNARSGHVRWTYNGGRISGAASVIGHVVYFSNLNNTTIGLDARTGKRVFRWSDGEFNPVISDGRRLYVTGYQSEYAFVPRHIQSTRKQQRHRRHG